LTVGSIALIGMAAWLVLGGAGWNGTLIRATFVGLSAVAVPHLLLHGVAPLCEASVRQRKQSLHVQPGMTSKSRMNLNPRIDLKPRINTGSPA
jgi:hypothetical protein